MDPPGLFVEVQIDPAQPERLGLRPHARLGQGDSVRVQHRVILTCSQQCAVFGFGEENRLTLVVLDRDSGSGVLGQNLELQRVLEDPLQPRTIVGPCPGAHTLATPCRQVATDVATIDLIDGEVTDLAKEICFEAGEDAAIRALRALG